MLLKDKLVKIGDFNFRYRGILPIPFIILVFIYYMYDLYHHVYSYDALVSGWWASLLISLMGLLIRCFTVAHAPKNTSGRNTKEGQIAEVLNTTGVYSICRNPLYLGNFLMGLGFMTLSLNILIILIYCVVYFAYYLTIIMAEENFLLNKFKEAYIAWCDVTNCIIPSFARYKVAELSFSLRNVLRREYTGLMLIALIMYIFAVARDGFYLHTFSIFNFYTLLFVATIIIYIALRTIRKKTTWFDVEGRVGDEVPL